MIKFLNVCYAHRLPCLCDYMFDAGLSSLLRVKLLACMCEYELKAFNNYIMVWLCVSIRPP